MFSCIVDEEDENMLETDNNVDSGDIPLECKTNLSLCFHSCLNGDIDYYEYSELRSLSNHSYSSTNSSYSTDRLVVYPSYSQLRNQNLMVSCNNCYNMEEPLSTNSFDEPLIQLMQPKIKSYVDEHLSAIAHSMNSIGSLQEQDESLHTQFHFPQSQSQSHTQTQTQLVVTHTSQVSQLTQSMATEETQSEELEDIDFLV